MFAGFLFILNWIHFSGSQWEKQTCLDYIGGFRKCSGILIGVRPWAYAPAQVQKPEWFALGKWATLLYLHCGSPRGISFPNDPLFSKV